MFAYGSTSTFPSESLLATNYWVDVVFNGTSLNPCAIGVPAGTSCSDGNACNGEEYCDGFGACLPGTALPVDDGNACTLDSCDATFGVVHTSAPTGTSCGDANVCNGNEVCGGAGTCFAGMPPALDDGNPCTVDSCDPTLGVVHASAPAGTSCADANACNGVEACDGDGACLAGTPPSLDDGNPCTIDSCDPVLGGIHVPAPAGTSCSDGNACNGVEACGGTGTCVAGTAPVVDDGDVCTVDSCDPVYGVSHSEIPGCGVPPDPVTVAPPSDRTVATDIAAATEFLYKGANPIQTGVADGVIEPNRVAVIRGLVRGRDRTPSPG